MQLTLHAGGFTAGKFDILNGQGVFSDAWVDPLARVLERLGSEHVLVVHAEDGLDEISTVAPTHVVEAGPGGIEEYEVTPGALGMAETSLDGLEVNDALESLDLIRMALCGGPGERAEQARRLVALNAGAALYAAGLQPSIADGVAEAMRLQQSGIPWLRVEALADYTAALKEA